MTNAPTGDATTEAKRQAAALAAAGVRDGQLVGLGHGSTAHLMVRALARRLHTESLRLRTVAASLETEALARELGFHVEPLDADAPLDIYLDGADEIDPEARLLKGGGGALLREKMLATHARQRVIMIDPSKVVARLGLRTAVPVEVVPFGAELTRRRLAALGADARIRHRNGAPFVTDQGNFIVDCRFARGLDNPEDMALAMKRLLGALEPGLFLASCDLVVIGTPTSAEAIPASAWQSRHREFLA